jgi:hypothetical protein
MTFSTNTPAECHSAERHLNSTTQQIKYYFIYCAECLSAKSRVAKKLII